MMMVNTDLSLEHELDALGPSPKKRGSPERDIQRTCIRWLRTVIPGAIVAAVVNEQAGAGRTREQRMRFGQARKASGVVTGFFDTIALLPNAQTLLIEWKAPGGVVSEAQQRVHHQARGLGHMVIVADGLEGLRYELHLAQVRTMEAPGAPMREPKVSYAKGKLPTDQVPF